MQPKHHSSFVKTIQPLGLSRGAFIVYTGFAGAWVYIKMERMVEIK